MSDDFEVKISERMTAAETKINSLEYKTESFEMVKDMVAEVKTMNAVQKEHSDKIDKIIEKQDERMEKLDCLIERQQQSQIEISMNLKSMAEEQKSIKEEQKSIKADIKEFKNNDTISVTKMMKNSIPKIIGKIIGYGIAGSSIIYTIVEIILKILQK